MGGIDGKVQGDAGGRRFHRVLVSLCVFGVSPCRVGCRGGGGTYQEFTRSSCRIFYFVFFFSLVLFSEPSTLDFSIAGAVHAA